MNSNVVGHFSNLFFTAHAILLILAGQLNKYCTNATLSR